MDSDGGVAARETSSLTIRQLLVYVREQAGDEGVQRVLSEAAVPHSLDELQDASRWVSYDTRIRLFAATVHVLRDPDAMVGVGASIVQQALSPSFLLLLRALGSPAQVFRQLPRSTAKFTTTSTMTVLECHTTSATLQFRLHDGYPFSKLDCDYCRGLFSAIPEIFGLPPANVVHDICQGDGHPACIYHVTWSRRRHWSRSRRADDVELLALRHQLRDLQSASAELVGSDDMDAVLERITRLAASSVLAHGYLLAVLPVRGGPPLVHATGVPADEVDAIAARLLAGDDLGPRAVVVDVVSARRWYGRLAALYEDEISGTRGERQLLAAYAGHAAAALDLLTALDASRHDEARAHALLELANQLAGLSDAHQVAQVVAAALPVIVGCPHAGVLLWDAVAGEMRTAASVGLGPPQAGAMLAVLRPQSVPELVDMITSRRPVTVVTATATASLKEILTRAGIHTLIAVPLLADDELLGVVTASWSADAGPLDGESDLMLRLTGVADQAATALHSATLLTRVRHQALHDALTGLPNRVLFADRLEHSLITLQGVAILFCDLDRFKQVNDTLGHEAGDELLRQVAGRLVAVAPPGSTVGRLSGDEFAVLVSAPTDPEAVARTLARDFEQPFRMEGRELRVTISTGIARSVLGDDRAEELLHDADGAMYDAKQRGRNQISVASRSSGDAAVPAPDSLEQELRRALTDAELRLYYQPIVVVTESGAAGALTAAGLPQHELRAVEALVRWEHPRLGLLQPGSFLGVAEEGGVVLELDRWVLRRATQDLADWPGPHRPQRVAVNLSGRSLADVRLRASVLDSLAASGLAPDELDLEVVESRALVDLPGVRDRLVALQHLGIRITLDDFGTGYSTLSWIQLLPADRIKLDQTFTSAVTKGPRERALVRGVLALARELGFEVVAEGVETREQLDVLLAQGYRVFQGYLFGRPVPLSSFREQAAAVATSAAASS